MAKITVPMILEEFSEEGRQLSWAIMFIEPGGLLSEEDKPIPPQVYSYILGKDALYFLEWEELCRLAAGFEYVVELQLIGFKNKEQIIQIYENPDEAEVGLKPFCDIMVDIDDGELIELYVKDKVKSKEILDRVTKRFGSLPFSVYRS